MFNRSRRRPRPNRLTSSFIYKWLAGTCECSHAVKRHVNGHGCEDCACPVWAIGSPGRVTFYGHR